MLVGDPAYAQNQLRQDLWRAGHAHAGVLLILSLVTLRYVDDANLSKGLKRIARYSIPAAAILLPVAFFLSVASPEATEPNALIYLAYVGAVSLGVGLLVLGVGLIRDGRASRDTQEREDYEPRTDPTGRRGRHSAACAGSAGRPEHKRRRAVRLGFCPEHDYIAINGMFLANQTRQDNARVHQRLYDEVQAHSPESMGRWRSARGFKIRLLASGVAVVHVRSEFRLKSDPEKKTKNIITAVMHKQQGKWEIVASITLPSRSERGRDRFSDPHRRSISRK